MGSFLKFVRAFGPLHRTSDESLAAATGPSSRQHYWQRDTAQSAMTDYFTTEEFYNAFFYVATTAFTTMLCMLISVTCAKPKKTTRKTESDQGIVLTNQVPQESIPGEARSSEDPKRPRTPVPPPNIPVAPAVKNDHTLREVESIKADKSG